MKRKKTLLTPILAGAIILAGAVGITVFNYQNTDKDLNKIVLYVEGIPVSYLEYRYYYLQQTESFNQEYADNIEALEIDTNTDYHLQPISSSKDEEKTWGDIIDTMTFSCINEIYHLYNEAQTNGYDPEVAKSFLSAQEEHFKEHARDAGISLDQYMSAVYDSKAYYAALDDILEKESIAKAYRQKLTESVTIEDDEILKYYEEHPNEYDVVTYRAYSLDIGDFLKSKSDEEVISTEQAKTMAEEKIQEMKASVKDEQSFIEVCEHEIEEKEDAATVERYKRRDASLHKKVTASELKTESLSDWLFSTDRKKGDVEYIWDDTEQYFHLLYFIGRERKNKDALNVRMIYIPYKTSYIYDYVVTDESKEEAKDTVDLIMNSMKENPSEDNFIRLAKEYNQDLLKKESGGLWTNVTENTFSRNIADWIYDKKRINGDYTFIEDSAGISVIYYVQTNESTTWKEEIKNVLMSQKILEILSIPEADSIEYEWVED